MEQFGFQMQYCVKKLIELENRVVPDQTFPLGQSDLIMFCFLCIKCPKILGFLTVFIIINYVSLGMMPHDISSELLKKCYGKEGSSTLFLTL